MNEKCSFIKIDANVKLFWSITKRIISFPREKLQNEKQKKKSVTDCLLVWVNSYDSPHNCQTIALVLLLGDPCESGGNGLRTEIMKRQRLQEGMREDRRSEGQKGKKEKDRKRDGVTEPADVKVPLITSCFSSAPSLCPSLSVPLFLSVVPTWIPLPALHSDVTLVFDPR